MPNGISADPFPESALAEVKLSVRRIEQLERFSLMRLRWASS